ncbi:unnamed protein product [Boreogadus saida]
MAARMVKQDPHAAAAGHGRKDPQNPRRDPRRSRHTAPTLGVRRPDDPNTQCTVPSVQGAGATALAPASGGPVAVQPSSLVGTSVSSCPQRTWGCGRGPPLSGPPPVPAVGGRWRAVQGPHPPPSGPLPATPAVGMDWTLSSPPAVLDLPTLLRLEVRWPGFPDPFLVLPRLGSHCRATGEGGPSRVHPGTTTTAAENEKMYVFFPDHISM